MNSAPTTETSDAIYFISRHFSRAIFPVHLLWSMNYRLHMKTTKKHGETFHFQTLKTTTSIFQQLQISFDRQRALGCINAKLLTRIQKMRASVRAPMKKTRAKQKK